MKRRIRVAAASSLLALGVLGLNACGGGDDDEGTVTEATVSPETTTEATVPPETTTVAKLPPVNKQQLTRVANRWASRFAVKACTPIMGQPVCVRLDCARHLGDPIENCTPVSAAFQRSFADATVEDIALKGIAVIGKPVAAPVHRAAVKFSNGEVVVFSGGVPPGEKQLEWGIAPPNRRFYQAAAPRE
jgi:hypothetical protein